MTTLDYIPIPAFQDNYIWVVTDGRSAIVVDPGEAPPVHAYCRDHGLLITAILLTHRHDDHVGGVAELLSTGPVAENVTVYGPALELIDSVTVRVRQGDDIQIESPAFRATVLDVPGHTAGHIAYYQPQHEDDAPHLFCGDTLFASGCGRLFEGTPAQMLSSLDVLAGLAETTRVHCAHEHTVTNILISRVCEPTNVDIEQWLERAQAMRAAGEPTLPTTIGHEKAVNPFLRIDQLSIHDALSSRFGLTESDRLATFTLLRRWKDEF